MIVQDDRVTLSRNETESLCMKAARGAGFSWGMAEEAGFAAGWLAAQGIDGGTALLALLTLRLAGGATGTPRPGPGYWQCSGNGPLCPMHLGAALIDHAVLTDGPFSRDTRLDPVQSPVLLLPFLVRGAQISRKWLEVEWQTGSLRIAPDGAWDGQAATAWARQNMLALKITPASYPGAPIAPCGPGRLPSLPASTLNGLDVLALRTTVPASSASRSGAGSATSDND